MNMSVPFVQRRLNSLAILTGCFSAIWGFVVFGWPFIVLPFLLALGAILQPRLPLQGKWLMRVSALLLSVAVFPIGVPSVVGGIKASVVYPDRSMIMTVSLSLASVLLVALCDVLLLVDMRPRKNSEDVTGPSKTLTLWLLWVVALSLTLYFLAMSVPAFHAYLRYGRFDVFLMWVFMTLVVLVFDVALVVQAAKGR